MHHTGRPPPHGLRLTVGFLLGFGLLQGLAVAFGSDRGKAGLPVALAVVAALIGTERFLFARPLGDAAAALGFRPAEARVLAVALAASLLLLAVIPVFAQMTGAHWIMAPGWYWLVPGLFAQAGIAEEALFRGYLFRHLRQRRSFARAALLAALPFVAAHLLLFASLPWPVALAALLLAAATSFPLARAFERGGGSLWPAAILHCAIQAPLKLGTMQGAGTESLPLVWLAASAIIPFSVFLVPWSRGISRP